MIPSSCTDGKDKPITMILVRICRRHFVKLVLAIAVLYLVFALRFFGSPDNSNTREEKKAFSPKVTNLQPLQDNVNIQHVDKGALKKTAAETAEKLIKQKPPPADIHDDIVAGPKIEKVELPTFQLIDDTEEHRKQRLKVLKEVYAVPHTPDDVYKLNESHSRDIDLDRPPTDLRPDECIKLEYDLNTLPTVSIIMPIYNEALSMLLRAVHSAINNTPQKLLVDIILVDDDSKNENLKEPLDKYVAMLPSKVKVLRNHKREGLIRARMRGAAIAKGEVLMFQDVHTEFGPGWAEPTLKYIQDHPNTVVQPVVEELEVNSIAWPKKEEKDHDDMWRGVFMWDMRYAWNQVPKRYTSWRLQRTSPWPNPVLVGCSLAVGRTFFDHIGGFDQGLEVWGGENIELSLRTWMCGGRMIIHPCSRIAHVFKPFSYSFDGDKEKIIGKNSIRVVETWMDDRRDYYYASNYVYDFKRVELNDKEKQSLREHKALREKLKCKSFEWYLKNVLPEMNLPTKDMTALGEVQNYASKACFMVHDDGYVVSTRDCYTYSRLKDDQEFSVNKKGQLMHFGKCVHVTSHFLLKVGVCGSGSEETGWKFEVDDVFGMQVGVLKYYYGDGETRCLQQVTNVVEAHKNQQMPQLMPCSAEREVWQRWFITYNLGYDLVPPRPV